MSAPGDELECVKCRGCGKVANDRDRTPWVGWMNLPLASSAAVLAGIVRPIPCEACGGTGRKPRPS